MSTPPPRHRTKHRGIYYRNGSTDPDAWPRRYIIWFEDSAGKGRTETLPEGSNMQDALARQAELRGKRARGERIVVSNVTLGDFALEWLEEQRPLLAAKTFTGYKWAVDGYIAKELGRRRLTEITVDDVANLIALMRRDGKKTWTIRGVLTPFSRIMRTAERRNLIASNPVKQLDRSERPKGDQRKMRILSTAEIELLVPKVPAAFRALILTLVFTGMRISEALELRWREVDFAGGHILVLKGKTNQATRSIVLMPALARKLKALKLASKFSGDDDFVFGTSTGTRQSPDNVRTRGLNEGIEASKIPHVTIHELRHTFASILIGRGLDVTFVADQLGHADPAITLRTYAKLFDPAARRDEARKSLEDGFGKVVGE